MRRSVRIVLALAVAAAASVLGAAAALACIPIATLNLSQQEAAPGAQMTASMHQASAAVGPVLLHWGAVDGPVLASAVPDPDSGLTVSFKLPDNAAPGYYTVVATQDLKPGSATWGMPARAVVHVVSPGGAPVGESTLPSVPVLTRPTGLAVGGGPDIGLLAVIGLAAAAVGLLAAGGAALLLGRAPAASPSRASTR